MQNIGQNGVYAPQVVQILASNVKLLLVMFPQRELKIVWAMRISSYSKRTMAYRIIFDVRVFHDLGADLRTSEVVLARCITKIECALLRAVKL